MAMRNVLLAVTPPLLKNDEQLYDDVYGDEFTMLPYLSILWKLSPDEWKQRREAHRQGFAAGTSAFLDLTLQHEGQEVVVGTTGFRKIENGAAEWGVVIGNKWGRSGFAKEAFRLSLQFAKTNLATAEEGVKTITAATTAENQIMQTFLTDLAGFAATGESHFDKQSGTTWLHYERPLYLSAHTTE